MTSIETDSVFLWATLEQSMLELGCAVTNIQAVEVTDFCGPIVRRIDHYPGRLMPNGAGANAGHADDAHPNGMPQQLALHPGARTSSANSPRRKRLLPLATSRGVNIGEESGADDGGELQGAGLRTDPRTDVPQSAHTTTCCLACLIVPLLLMSAPALLVLIPARPCALLPPRRFWL